MMRALFIFSLFFSLQTRAEVSSAVEKEILQFAFSLRDEAALPALKRARILDEVAHRASQANLNRADFIEHTDAEGKSLAVRALEENYSGATGEIIAVTIHSCSRVDEAGALQGEVLARELRDLIRNSPAHYRLIMSRTGKAWNEFGASILQNRESLQGICIEKSVLTLVLGKTE